MHALVSVQKQKFVLTVFWFCVMSHVLQFREIAYNRVRLCYDMNVLCKALTSAVRLMSCVLFGLPYSRLQGYFFASDIKMYTEIHGVCCQGCLIYDVYNIYINWAYFFFQLDWLVFAIMTLPSLGIPFLLWYKSKSRYDVPRTKKGN